MKNLLLLLIALLGIIACEMVTPDNPEIDNPEIDSTEVEAPYFSKYLPMAVGNYWVYQKFSIDGNGKETARNLFDSVYICSDTIINNICIYKFGQSDSQSNYKYSSFYYRRDSAGYLLNYSSEILSKSCNIYFSDQNFSDTLNRFIRIDTDDFYGPKGTKTDTLYTITSKMELINGPVTVPAGTFNVLNYKQTVVTNPIYTANYDPKYNNNYYAKSVGLVLYSLNFFLGKDYIEYRLIRYHVK